MRSRSARFLSLSLSVALASGCAPAFTRQTPRDPNLTLPAAFAPAPDAPTTAPEPAPPGGVGQQSWREFFADPDLSALIDAALTGNQELNIQLQEIVIAQAEVLARQGEYLPRVSAGAGVGLDKVGRDTSQGASDEALELPDPLAHYRLGFAASWEVDVWKRMRTAARAAGLRYLASSEGRNFLATQVVAEIASSYYEVLALDRQLAVLHDNIEIQQSALNVVRLQKEAARATQLAVSRFEAEVLKNQSRQYTLQQQRVQAENRINFLLGRYPQRVAPVPDRFQLPLRDTVAAGIPSQLLENRPDVRQAALQLEATKLDVKAARAAFYPALSIEAGVGYESFNLSHLFHTPDSLLHNVAGNLIAPLINRKALSAQYTMATAQQLQAVYNYERTLLNAFTEVANQLAVLSNLERSYRLQRQQVETLTQSIEISNVLFNAARADYMEVLTTRRDALDAQMEMIETRSQQLQARVRIYQALGGGWR